MRKLIVVGIFTLGIGIALQIPSASAQTGTSGTTAKPPAQSTTGSTTAKPPAAKPASSTAATANHPVATLDTETARTSYALGMNIAHTVKMQPLELDQNAFVQGM